MSDEINEGVQESILGNFEDLETWQSIFLPMKGGWKMKISKTSRGLEYEHYNPWNGQEDKRAFVTVTNKINDNGLPKMFQEESLGIPCRNCGIENDGRIVGALVTDNKCEIVDRFSLSKIVYVQEHDFEISPEGEVSIDGESKGFVGIIFMADENRIDGYVCVTFPEKMSEVIEIEMEDLLMCQVPAIKGK